MRIWRYEAANIIKKTSVALYLLKRIFKDTFSLYLSMNFNIQKLWELKSRIVDKF